MTFRYIQKYLLIYNYLVHAISWLCTQFKYRLWATSIYSLAPHPSSAYPIAAGVLELISSHVCTRHDVHACLAMYRCLWRDRWPSCPVAQDMSLIRPDTHTHTHTHKEIVAIRLTPIGDQFAPCGSCSNTAYLKVKRPTTIKNNINNNNKKFIIVLTWTAAAGQYQSWAAITSNLDLWHWMARIINILCDSQNFMQINLMAPERGVEFTIFNNPNL